MNYNHLHHFWVVGTEGSFTRAGRRLQLTHSTLSAQLRALEETLGQKLFVRKSRGIALTPYGEHLKARCDELFRVGAELEESLRTGRVDARRVVRIGAMPSIPRTLVYRALQTMSVGRDVPTISFLSGDLDVLADAIVAGKLHAALTDRPPSSAVDARVYAHLLGKTRILFFANARLALRTQKGFPRSIDGAPVLLPRANTTLREALMRWFAERGVRPQIVGELDDAPLMKTFASHGRGLVPIREPLVDEARRVYGLHRVGIAEGVEDSLYAVTLEKRVRHPDVQHMIMECRRALARESRGT